MSTHSSTSSKIHTFFWRLLLCCGCEDEEEQRPALKIGHPTNFRREDITLPGLGPEQQSFLRAKAIADATRLYDSLQPLQHPTSHSHPNTTGTPLPPSSKTLLPSYEDFTTPHPAPGIVERVKRHSRKISNSLTGGLAGWQGVGGEGEERKYEMRRLMGSHQPSRVVTPSEQKGSFEFGRGDGDGVGMLCGVGLVEGCRSRYDGERWGVVYNRRSN